MLRALRWMETPLNCVDLSLKYRYRFSLSLSVCQSVVVMGLSVKCHSRLTQAQIVTYTHHYIVSRLP